MRGRAPYLIFASCLGAAIALLVYRFGVMPLGWNAPAAKAFTWAPAVLVLAPWQLVHQSERKQWPWGAAVATSLASFVAVMLIAYFALPSPARSRLVPRSLPGMTVSLPSGKQQIAELKYENGQLLLSDVESAGGVLSLHWRAGGADSEEETALLIKSTQEAVKGVRGRTEKWRGPGGASTTVILVDTYKGTVSTATVTCGARRVVFSAMGIDEMQELLRRVLRSFVCQPDPAEDAALHGLPWIWSPPDAWEVQDELGSTFTDGESVVSVGRVGSKPTADAWRLTAKTLFTADGGQVELGEVLGHQISFKATDEEGIRTVGWMRHVSCPRGDVVISVLVDDNAESKAALAAIDAMIQAHGRCLNEGEPAPRWPVPAPAE